MGTTNIRAYNPRQTASEPPELLLECNRRRHRQPSTIDALEGAEWRTGSDRNDYLGSRLRAA
ncbi:hypothetical protein ZHAS_00009905 [Anopheles sinensis]|uniref:Uncharacterized protein n=1 Tax=Anopheles sinensis TaxID=74873 RepID=A0A084VW59_ANOSI|nr:hypothetical protein ZHAS_00009905 [Anopheles sinensis]